MNWNEQPERQTYAVDIPEQESSLARLGAAQDRLGKEIDALAARLSPVLAPDHPNTTANPAESGSSAIHEAARIAEAQGARLGYIASRIEL